MNHTLSTFFLSLLLIIHVFFSVSLLARVKARACKWSGSSNPQLRHSRQVCGIASGKPFLGIKFHEGNCNSLRWIQTPLPVDLSIPLRIPLSVYNRRGVTRRWQRRGKLCKKGWKKRLETGTVSTSK